MTIHENIEVGSLTYFGCRCRLVRMVLNVVLRAPGGWASHEVCRASCARSGVCGAQHAVVCSGRSGQRSGECAGFLCSPVVATTLVRPFCGVVGVSADDIRLCDVLVIENSRDVILRFAQQITLAF